MTLYSRPGNDITARFPWIAADIGRLMRRTLILDGELVAFDDHERPDFHLLRRKQSAVVAFLFDILESKLLRSAFPRALMRWIMQMEVSGRIAARRTAEQRRLRAGGWWSSRLSRARRRLSKLG